MQINSVEFHNYRNLDGLKVHFCRNKSFIIGENGIKTNKKFFRKKVKFEIGNFEQIQSCKY